MAWVRTMTAALLAPILASCATYKVTLRDNDGHTKYCESQGHGLIGMAVARHQFSDYVNEAGKEGFLPDESTRQ